MTPICGNVNETVPARPAEGRTLVSFDWGWTLSPQVAVIAVLALVTIFIQGVATGSGKKSGCSKAIPGPWSVPFLGSLPILGRTPHAALTRLRSRYGDVFRVQLGSLPAVVLCGLETVREALVHQGDTFAGRPALYTFQLASEGKSMSFNSCAAQWKAHRKLAERALRMVSDQKRCVQLVAGEAGRLADGILARAGGTPYDPTHDIMWSLAHVKYTLCYGDSRASGDFAKMIDTTLRLIGCHNRGNIINFFPWARRFLVRETKQLKDICDTMLTITKKAELEHLDSFDSGNIRDVLDALIQLGMRRPCPLERERVLHTVQEYIGAGLDIVYMTLTWVILYLTKFPEVQARIQREIDDVIGSERGPSLEDARRMPYTQATIQEVLRHSAVVPLALPHSTLRDTTLRGYHIPEGTLVLVNLHSITRDLQLWDNPDDFLPERHLDNSRGEWRVKEEGFCSFGMGRRRCVGEQLGKTELFLYITTLLQRCHLRDATEGPGGASLTAQPGIVLRPMPFKLMAEPRISLATSIH